MNKIYLVYGNTYFEGYGAYIRTFGIFSSLELAEEVKKKKEDEYFEREMMCKYPSIDDRSEIEFNIEEIEVDKVINICLGGYAE